MTLRCSLIRLSRGWIAATVILVTAGCGKSPTGPSSSGTNSPSSVATYVGTIGLSDGRSGTVMLRPSSSFAALRPINHDLLSRVVALFEAPLRAQGSPASGALILPDEVVNLSGSYSGNTFNVSGGGYSLTAIVSAGSLSGSGTASNGASVMISPPDPVNVPLVPAPSNASGVYTGTYSITAPSFFTRTSAATGAVVSKCSFNTVITGTLTLELLSTGSGNYAGHLSEMWTELSGSCQFRDSAPVSPPGPKGVDATVMAAAIQLGWVEQNTPTLGGVQTLTQAFIGAVSGTTIVARISRSRLWTPHPSVGGGEIHTDGYPAASADVTLVKQ